MCIRDSFKPADVVGVVDNGHLVGLIVLRPAAIGLGYHKNASSAAAQQACGQILRRLFTDFEMLLLPGGGEGELSLIHI